MHSGKLKPWFFGTILLFLLTLKIGADTISRIDTNEQENAGHSRQKRVLWITSDGRLALPPGTTLVITPSLSMPFVRYPPQGFLSNMTISLPFTIDFNKLGLTDNENPYGVLPPIFARSMGRAAGNMIGDYVMKILAKGDGGRRKRDVDGSEPVLKDEHKDALHGGERALLYVAAQEFLDNFGLNGKACLLRAICEVQAHPMKNYGLFGEFLKLFLTASKSPYSALMREYVEAEEAGSGKSGPAECWPYLKDCPKSLFVQNHHNKYSENQKVADDADVENEIEEVAISNTKSKVTYDPNNFSE